MILFEEDLDEEMKIFRCREDNYAENLIAVINA
jgi:hypothetical protein